MAEVMLEGYNFGGVYVAIQAVLALYAQGTCEGKRQRNGILMFLSQVLAAVLLSTLAMVSPTLSPFSNRPSSTTTFVDWTLPDETSQET